VKLFDNHKTRMIGLQCGKETITLSSRFHRIPERDGWTHKRTDKQTDGIAISTVKRPVRDRK